MPRNAPKTKGKFAQRFSEKREKANCYYNVGQKFPVDAFGIWCYAVIVNKGRPPKEGKPKGKKGVQYEFQWLH